jgi:hypothetical protein
LVVQLPVDDGVGAALQTAFGAPIVFTTPGVIEKLLLLLPANHGTARATLDRAPYGRGGVAHALDHRVLDDGQPVRLPVSHELLRHNNRDKGRAVLAVTKYDQAVPNVRALGGSRREATKFSEQIGERR